jgi:transcriptional regulator with XRE-family HTH domain
MPYVNNWTPLGLRLHENLSQLAAAASLSHAEICRRLHIASGQYFGMFAQPRGPTLGTLVAIARVLGVDVSEVVRGCSDE